MLVKTLQSIQLHACGDNTRHIIPRSQKPQSIRCSPCRNVRIIQYRSHGDNTKPHFYAGGNNTKHTILHSWGPRKALNSALADHITVLCSWRQYKATTSRLWRQHKTHNSTLVEPHKAHNSVLAETT